MVKESGRARNYQVKAGTRLNQREVQLHECERRLHDADDHVKQLEHLVESIQTQLDDHDTVESRAALTGGIARMGDDGQQMDPDRRIALLERATRRAQELTKWKLVQRLEFSRAQQLRGLVRIVHDSEVDKHYRGRSDEALQCHTDDRGEYFLRIQELGCFPRLMYNSYVRPRDPRDLPASTNLVFIPNFVCFMAFFTLFVIAWSSSPSFGPEMQEALAVCFICGSLPLGILVVEPLCTIVLSFALPEWACAMVRMAGIGLRPPRATLEGEEAELETKESGKGGEITETTETPETVVTAVPVVPAAIKPLEKPKKRIVTLHTLAMAVTATLPPLPREMKAHEATWNQAPLNKSVNSKSAAHLAAAFQQVKGGKSKNGTPEGRANTDGNGEAIPGHVVLKYRVRPIRSPWPWLLVLVLCIFAGYLFLFAQLVIHAGPSSSAGLSHGDDHDTVATLANQSSSGSDGGDRDIRDANNTLDLGNSTLKPSGIDPVLARLVYFPKVNASASVLFAAPRPATFTSLQRDIEGRAVSIISNHVQLPDDTVYLRPRRFHVMWHIDLANTSVASFDYRAQMGMRHYLAKKLEVHVDELDIFRVEDRSISTKIAPVGHPHHFTPASRRMRQQRRAQRSAQRRQRRHMLTAAAAAAPAASFGLHVVRHSVRVYIRAVIGTVEQAEALWQRVAAKNSTTIHQAAVLDGGESGGAGQIVASIESPSVAIEELVEATLPLGTVPGDFMASLATSLHEDNINIVLAAAGLSITMTLREAPVLMQSACAGFPCLHGGHCKDLGAIAVASNITARLTTGSPNADIIIPRATATASAAAATVTANPGYNCTCVGPWQGGRCETSVGSCLSDADCRGGGDAGGRCSSAHTCVCGVGWSGVVCGQYDGDCRTHLDCRTDGDAGATCGGKESPFMRCTCSYGRVGRRCEIDVGACSNHAQCRAADSNAACRTLGTPGPLATLVAPRGGVNICACSTQWGGRLCDAYQGTCTTSSDCTSLDTSATCVGSAPSKACVCSPGWAGEQCSTQIGTCTTVGECQAGGDTSAHCAGWAPDKTCVCSVGWTGTLCELDHGVCSEDSHCSRLDYGASCVGSRPTKTCSCSVAWSGTFCQVKEGTCARTGDCNALGDVGGTCVGSSPNKHCVCSPGWSGELCHRKEGDCKTNDECSSRDKTATCINWRPHRKCVCSFGWSGIRCQTKHGACKSDDECRAYGDACASCIGADPDRMCQCGWQRGGYRCERGWVNSTCYANIFGWPGRHDCAGLCVSERDILAGLGDGVCEDGTMGKGFDFYCSAFGYDADDCLRKPQFSAFSQNAAAKYAIAAPTSSRNSLVRGYGWDFTHSDLALPPAAVTGGFQRLVRNGTRSFMSGAAATAAATTTAPMLAERSTASVGEASLRIISVSLCRSRPALLASSGRTQRRAAMAEHDEHGCVAVYGKSSAQYRHWLRVLLWARPTQVHAAGCAKWCQTRQRLRRVPVTEPKR